MQKFKFCVGNNNWPTKWAWHILNIRMSKYHWFASARDFLLFNMYITPFFLSIGYKFRVLHHIPRVYSNRLDLGTSDFKKLEGGGVENENIAQSTPNWRGWKMLSRRPKQTKKCCTTQRGSLMQRKGLLCRTWKPASKACQWCGDLFRADKQKEQENEFHVR